MLSVVRAMDFHAVNLGFNSQWHLYKLMAARTSDHNSCRAPVLSPFSLQAFVTKEYTTLIGLIYSYKGGTCIPTLQSTGNLKLHFWATVAEE